MNYVQSKHFDIFYDETELYAARIGEPCTLPLDAYGFPNLVTHMNVALLSVLWYQETVIERHHCQAWPFPYDHGTLVEREVARYEFRYEHRGRKFYAIFVSDMGRDLLDSIPALFLARNLINCSNYFDPDEPDADWLDGHYLHLVAAIGFFLHKLSVAELPEFLTFEHSPIRVTAREALDACVQC